MERRELLQGGTIEYWPDWLEPDAAGRLLEQIRGDLVWEEREIVLFGKRILQPRLVAWAGTVPYRYSGQTLPPRPFPRALEDVVARVVTRTGVSFNHVLANWYRNGNDSMGFHADDEPELGPEPTVATLSLGVARRFVVASRRGHERLEYSLEHGSLLLMRPPCQAKYRHAIPKERSVTEARVSLTFRRVLPLDDTSRTR